MRTIYRGMAAIGKKYRGVQVEAGISCMQKVKGLTRRLALLPNKNTVHNISGDRSALRCGRENRKRTNEKRWKESKDKTKTFTEERNVKKKTGLFRLTAYSLKKVKYPLLFKQKKSSTHAHLLQCLCDCNIPWSFKKNKTHRKIRKKKKRKKKVFSKTFSS